MKRIDDTKIEEIKNANDIVDVLSNYVSLIKKGKNYTCICPFHNDTNPSMVVSQEKQIYKCFSCDAGGNVITFVQNFEKISFVEALKKLAQRASIELDIVESKPRVIDEDSLEYYHLNNEASVLYEYLLVENNNSVVKNYLEERHLTKEIIERFRIGYAPLDDSLTNLFKTKNLNVNKASQLGLLKINDEQYHDYYKNRIIYPIIDLYDNVIGFTARALGNVEPKYLNSSESKIFNKSQLLYNINNAKDSIKKARVIYILEGPNDVIAFYRAGLENAVCVMGTALTKEHIKIFKMLGIVDIILGFDGDAAGQKATINAIKVLESTHFNLKYLDFGAFDPDEYLAEYGVQKFVDHVKNPQSALEFKINYEFNSINTSNYEDKKKTVIKIVQELNNVLDVFDKEYYYNYLANLSGISYELISSYAQNQPLTYQTKKPVKKNVTLDAKNDLDNAALHILYFIMLNREYYEYFSREVGSFIDNKYRKLYNIVSAYYLNHHDFEVASLADLKINEDDIAMLMKIYLSYHYDENDNKQIFIDSVETIKNESLYLKIAELKKQLQASSDPLYKAEKSYEILEITKELNRIKEKKFNR